MPTKQDSRLNPRTWCDFPARAEGARGVIRGTCRNISLGGMLFVGGVLPVGQRVELQLQLPGGAFQATGEVRYHHHQPEGPAMGILFTRLAQNHLELISRFIEKHERSEG
jgi:hypothetical protein